MENSEFDYLKKAQWGLLSSLGAHNWQAISVDLGAGVVYRPAHASPFFFSTAEEWRQAGVFKENRGAWNLVEGLAKLSQMTDEDLAGGPKAIGCLKAFSPLTGQSKGVVEHPQYWNGGVVATAGELVLQGDALDQVLTSNAYGKDTGEPLWSFNAQA